MAKGTTSTRTISKKQHQQKAKSSSSKQEKQKHESRQTKSQTAAQNKKSINNKNNKNSTKHQSIHQTSPIVFDNDGGKDDIVALAVLLAGQAATENKTIQSTLQQVQVKEEQLRLKMMMSRQTSSKSSSTHTCCWNPIELTGITMLDGDCLIEPASDAMKRMLALVTPICPSLNPHTCVPIHKSPLAAVAAPFPLPWRRSSMTIDFLPVLNSVNVNAVLAPSSSKQQIKKQQLMHEQQQSGHESLAQFVYDSYARANNTPVTLLATGPLSNVSYCINKYGTAFTSKIGKIVIMGGAIDVPGNVMTSQMELAGCKGKKVKDGSAEWNIFWDAPAAKNVLEVAAAQDSLLKNKIYLFSLDSTNSVPITEEIVRSFGALDGSRFLMPSSSSSTSSNVAPLAQIAGTCWAIAPWYPKETAPKYYAWDVLCAVYLLDNRVCEFEKRSVKVVAGKDHPEEGKLVPVGNNKKKEVDGDIYVAKNVNGGLFYDILRTTLQL